MKFFKFLKNKFRKKSVETNDKSSEGLCVNQTSITKIDNLKKSNTKRHLVVDDILTSRMMLKYYLNEMGIEIDEATNGAEAVDIITKKGMGYYDVVWMDIKMPFMDGLNATKFIRHRGYNNIVVILTGYINRETLLKCKLDGADQIYAKPIIKENLYKMNLFNIY